MDVIEVVRDDGVVLVRIRREQVLNALDPAALTALLAAIEQAAADPEVRAIVLAGSERAFTTSEDLVAAADLDADAFARQIDCFQRLATALRHAPKPVVAAVAGYAYGGGLEIAVDCDLRIAGENARFACPEAEWGLSLSNGASILLRRLVGEGWARELLLFGAVLDAQEALRVGLVTRVVPVAELEAAALAAARRAAGVAPGAVRRTKELLNADPAGWEATLAAEAAAVCAGFAEPTARARLAAFAERRRGR